MATIAVHTYRLPIVDKLPVGQLIIARSTDNQNVPGNAAPLVLLAAA